MRSLLSQSAKFKEITAKYHKKGIYHKIIYWIYSSRMMEGFGVHQMMNVQYLNDDTSYRLPHPRTYVTIYLITSTKAPMSVDTQKLLLWFFCFEHSHYNSAFKWSNVVSHAVGLQWPNEINDSRWRHEMYTFSLTKLSDGKPWCCLCCALG